MNDKLPAEQKGCKKKSRGTKDQLLIDTTMLRDCRKGHTNLGIAWIDYKKADDMVPHSWILECLELVQVSDNILKFVKRSMANWQTELTSSRESLAKVNIRRGIFQGNICDVHDTANSCTTQSQGKIHIGRKIEN